jgi:glycosyltransferase involved in cell wall biosynthesis
VNNKILFLVSRSFYPTTGGREVVIYNYIEGLNRIYNCDVDVALFCDENEAKRIKSLRFVNNMFILQDVSTLNKIKNVLFKTMILRTWPLQVSVFYDKHVQKQIDKIIDENDYNYVITDMVRTSEYLRRNESFRGKRVLDMDDLLSNRYKRQATLIDNNTNVLGQYSKKMPVFINKMFNNRAFSKFILKFEADILSRYEKEVSKDFDNIIFVSKKESEQLNHVIKSDKAIDITIGVDYEYYSQKVTDIKEETICYLGNMNVAHNRQSVEYFIENILPLIEREISEIKFKVVGKCDKQFKDELAKYKNIEVTGMVDDIREHIQSCLVAVAPILFGSGIKTKVLETMAMGIPVVMNSLGAEGIDLVNEKNAIITDDWVQFAKYVVELIKNDTKRNYIASNAQKFIKEKHTWGNTLKNFEIVLRY